MDKALIVEKLEEAFDTKGESIKKYMGTHIYSDIMETKVSVKVGGAFEYPTLNEAITMKIQGKEIIYLNPKPTRVFAPIVLEEKVFSSETDDIKTETTNVLNTKHYEYAGDSFATLIPGAERTYYTGIRYSF